MSGAERSLKRTTFKTSRLLEFCSTRELTNLVGHGPDEWALVVLKELVDKGLDAAEEAGVSPCIEIAVSTADRSIAVTDNGPGFPARTIASILDFSARTSSKEAYCSPTRGQQGHALSTVLAMPFALAQGGEAPGRVVIEANGVRHAIALHYDPIRRVPIPKHDRSASFVKTGTRFAVHWPVSGTSKLVDAKARFLQIADAYTWLNPHLGLTLSWDGVKEITVKAYEAGWTKWLPSNPTSAHWYDYARFERRIAAQIAHDQDRKKDTLIREFLVEFRGLSGTAKQKAVLDKVGMARVSLSSLYGDRGFNRAKVAKLLSAMQAETKPVQPKQLGVVGSASLLWRFHEAGAEVGGRSFQYKVIEPHTRKTVPLGTVNVRNYLGRFGEPEFLNPEVTNPELETRGPECRFGAVLGIEKEGFNGLFEQSQLLERFDVGLASIVGQSTTSARRLIDEMCGDHSMKLFFVHDFDVAGFGIIGTLRRDTRRYEFVNDIEVVEVGLRLDDVRRYNLEQFAEPAARKGRNSWTAVRHMLRSDGATDGECEFLRTRRVEINALSNAQLIDMIERKLREHGIEKIVPDDAMLAKAYRFFVKAKKLEDALDKFKEDLDDEDDDDLVIPRRLRNKVKAILKKSPHSSWDAAVARLAGRSDLDPDDAGDDAAKESRVQQDKRRLDRQQRQIKGDKPRVSSAFDLEQAVTTVMGAGFTKVGPMALHGKSDGDDP